MNARTGDGHGTEGGTRTYLLPSVGLLLLILSGCAGTTVFTAYPTKIDPYKETIASRRPLNIAECLKSECESADRILYTMERGRIGQVLGETENSVEDYRCAMEAIRTNEEKATISASSVGAGAAAALVNDNARPYQAEGYERVMLHHLQALNYLSNNDLEGAGVEIRRANLQQEEAAKRHEREVEKAQGQADAKKVDQTQVSSVERHFAGLDEVAGKVKNSFQNAYTFYLSGAVYELLSQPSDAYIDYKRALEIFPGNRYLQKDVYRLATALEMDQDAEDLLSRYGDGIRNEIHQSDGHGDLIVLYEDGFVPAKEEIKFPLPAPGGNLVAVAFPVYKASWSDPVPLSVANGGAVVGNTEPLVYMDALAVKALKENIPGIVIRQFIRAAVKATTAKVAKDQLGTVGQLAANIWNIASERADLRSWLTLPANAQVLRTRLPTGDHSLTLSRRDVGLTNPVAVTIAANGITFLHVVRTGAEFYVKTIPVDASAGAVAVNSAGERGNQ